MRVSIERMRVFLLVGAGLLLVVIAAFLEYAHLRAHRLLKDLPGKLGAEITRESNGFTYSQSSKGKTVYTIHAAKLVQRKDGRTTLHDVGIVLYGQRQDRADRIYGSEFEYDQKAGVVRATGEVHLDLQAPASVDARGRADYAAGHGAGNAGAEHTYGDEQMVHVKTSGLVFVQSLGVASTDQEIEFQYGGLNGRAKGADYNSDTGITVLQSDVKVTGLRDGQPVLLNAAHAEMNRSAGQVTLTRARYVLVGGGSPSAGAARAISAEHAVVQLRPDGSVERVSGTGGVSLEQDGGTLKGQTGELTVSGANRPEAAQISGGVTFTEESALRQVEGRAGRGTARFDAAGQVESAAMTDAAEMHVRERSAASGSGSTKGIVHERTVFGDRIDVKFAAAGRNKRWTQEGTATGRARMLLVDHGVSGETTSELRGDTLTGKLIWDGKGAQLKEVSGRGHTSLRRHEATGAEETSEGESLEVSFAPAPAGRAAGAASSGIAAVSEAVQRGGVKLTRLLARRPGAPAEASPTVATADEAVYAGDGQTLTLNGQAQVTDANSVLRAETVKMARQTGDTSATGAVRVSYRQTGSAEPLHVLAARAEFRHDGGRATFFGGGGVPARLWQGASQIEAPTIEFSQGSKTLVAGAGPAAAERVRTVLVSGADGGASGKRDRREVIRVASRSLQYSDADRRAEFGGGVVLESSDSTVHASQMTAFLKPAAQAGAAASPAGNAVGLMGGSVDRVVAEGAVAVSEGERRATGERLVYTASDGLFMLTGTPGAPPKVVDEAQGTISGAALQFHAGDNSVMVVGAENGKVGEGRRVHTETQVRKR